MFENNLYSSHRYFLFSTGTSLKGKYFNTQEEALNAMYKYCQKNDIQVEVTEDDYFGKKFSNHNGVRFYINKVIY